MCDELNRRQAMTLNNGMTIPPIGYGTYPHTQQLLDSIPKAVRLGCKLIDSSDNYGGEQVVGEALRACQCEAADVTIVSKFSRPERTYELERCFDEGEAALGRGIDVYLLHWPYPHLWREQWRRMERLYLEGRCSAIGVCNFEVGKLEELLRFCEVMPSVNQFECHPLFQQRDLCDFCRDAGIVTMSYSPLARMAPELVDNKVMLDVASSHGRTVSQVVMRWNIQRGRIPIPAARSERHIRENVEVFDFALSDEEMASVDALERGMRVRFDPRTRFGMRSRARFLARRIVRH